VSSTHTKSFKEFAETLVLILEAPIGLDPSNLILLKDASLRCLCCICIDTVELLPSRFSFSMLTDLTRLKRIFFTATIFSFATNFLNEGLFTQ
jgi:hypothetical protein